MSAQPKKPAHFNQIQWKERLKKNVEHVYTMRFGGTVDTASALAVGAGLFATNPIFGRQLASLPYSLVPLTSAALGAAWMAWRALEPWRKEHVLASTLKIRSDESPIKPKPGEPVPGLLVGYCCDTGEPVYIDYEHLMRHLFILGQSGVGKTVAASSLMFQQIQGGGGLLFIDGKIDAGNIQQLYHFACYAGRQHDFMVVNPDDPENSNTYNSVLFGDPDEVADRILQLIPSTESNPGSDFYKQEAKQALNTVIAALQTARMAYNMIDLTVLLMSDAALLELENKLVLAAPDSEEAKAFSLFLDKFRQQPSQNNPNPTGLDMKKLKDVFGGIGGRLYTFGTGKFGKVMNSYDPDVNLYEAIRGNKIVYIALPTMGKDTTARNFGKMAIGDLRTAISWLQKLPEHERPWPPFMAFCDEAGSYVNDAWSRIPEQARSAHVFFVPAAQTAANFQAISNELYEMVIGNAWTKLFFKVGTQATAVEAADLIGKTTGIMRSISGAETASTSVSFLRAAPDSNEGSGASLNYGEREQEMHIISPDALKGLDKGECVMTYGGNRIYNVRIPMMKFDAAAIERFGEFRVNRFRSTGLFRPEGTHGRDHYASFVSGADFFKNVDRFLKVGQMKAVVKKAEREDKQDFKRSEKKAKAVLMKMGMEPDEPDEPEEEAEDVDDE